LINRWLERDKYGVSQFVRIAVEQFRSPPVQQFQRPGRVAHFVAQVVRPAAVCIDVVKMLVQIFWQQPRDKGKILVMRRGERFAIGLGRNAIK